MSPDLIETYLQQQQELTAVEAFAMKHDLKQIPAMNFYEELIPKSAPGPGQQYAFSVDLDRCTGCKACVTACHNENGLPEDETWRTVGLLYGGRNGDSVIQHVTSACHHCLDPACLNGCPVDAYVKEKDSGVVRHLEDQCIGCQYCTFTCAYDVPKYNRKKGIVHKCDMCISRLNVGEAPACARACPNGAIRITLVETAAVYEHPTDFVNIPDAPDSHYTLPTTRYETQKKFPSGTMAVDSYTLQPEHCHWPLVAMLVLTQLSVGAFAGGLFLNRYSDIISHPLAPAVQALVALCAGILAMAVSIFHLGRPHLAFRAVLGLRHSWLSREIIAFGLFAILTAFYALASWKHEGGLTNQILAIITAILGLFGIGCSIMVYKVTRRPFWDHPQTMVKFFLTTGILGLAAILPAFLFFGGSSKVGEIFVCRLMAALVLGKLLTEGIFLRHLREKEWTALKKTAFLMSRPLRRVTNARFILGLLGGVILPLVLAAKLNSSTTEVPWALVAAILGFSLIGESLERFLFFRAVVPLKMPGGGLEKDVL